EFEEAADAVVRGDAAKLRAMLAANPGLVHAKSERVHNSQLIHYIGANGFENWRQKTPKNAPEMLRILLDAGAEVDAKADAYGRGTTLGLVATSVHPVNAGVQIQLMEMLIQAGADVNGAPGGWNIVISALHNGRGLAARYLADHGATLDLESVAGVGRLDLVRRSFSPGGSLKPPATPKQMSDGFMWACEYGWPEVVAFLLDQGTDISEGAGADMTGLHWAIVGNQIEVVRLLLARGAPLEALNVYGGTALDCAVWCVENQDPGPEFLEIMHVLIDAGANREVYPGMAKDVDAAMERLARKKV
ncbi:MAG TPA: ankyrin repeat domain-containing protein, partial [Fimbriimonas sp.]|nr:ankyrin repeat domain-containing protein [Fimbriimonas sp.]